jgi:hypothetical protein
MSRNATEMIRWLWGALVSVYGISLYLPAVYRPGLGAPTSGLSGSVVLGYELVGGLPFAMLAPAWWANPAFGIGVVALVFGHGRIAMFFGMLATLLASSVLVFGPFPPDQFEFTQLYSGYFVWLSSMGMLAAFATATAWGTAAVPRRNL